MSSLLLTFLFVSAGVVHSYTSDALLDQVEWSNLPGADNIKPSPTFNQFSGYIAIDESTQKNYFYWFFESQNKPGSDPLAFWTNGGPGCGSLLGLATEHGPFHPDANGKLYRNPYSWNTRANMLYVEQPTGAGFSYSHSKSDYTVGDDDAVSDMVTFITKWLERFPQYAKNDFYLTSESYGGHYVPKLTKAILELHTSKINLKGSMIGNPFMDSINNRMGRMQRYYGAQLLPEPAWQSYLSICGTDALKKANDAECLAKESAFDALIGTIDHHGLGYVQCTSPQVGWLLKTLEGYPYEPCGLNYSQEYFNNPAVKKAIHANFNLEWTPCSTTVNYSRSDIDSNVKQYYLDILGSNTLKFLVYSGDDDSLTSTWSTQQWIWDLGYDVVSDWHAWTLDGETAGFHTLFTNKFAFVTVHGAGHEVPAYQPARALEVFNGFLNSSWFSK